MNRESFYEEGVVIQSWPGKAEVLLSANVACPGCAAQTICRSGGENQRSLVVADRFGVQPGERVQVEVRAGSLLIATFLLYGILLLLLLAGLAIGLLIFDDLAGALLALGLPALYALGVWAYTRFFPGRQILTLHIMAVDGLDTGQQQNDREESDSVGSAA